MFDITSYKFILLPPSLAHCPGKPSIHQQSIPDVEHWQVAKSTCHSSSLSSRASPSFIILPFVTVATNPYGRPRFENPNRFHLFSAITEHYSGFAIVLISIIHVYSERLCIHKGLYTLVILPILNHTDCI